MNRQKSSVQFVVGHFNLAGGKRAICFHRLQHNDGQIIHQTRWYDTPTPASLRRLCALLNTLHCQGLGESFVSDYGWSYFPRFGWHDDSKWQAMPQNREGYNVR